MTDANTTDQTPASQPKASKDMFSDLRKVMDNYLASMPTPEEFRQKRLKDYAWVKDNLIRSDAILARSNEANLTPSRFNITSIESWISVLQQTEVPYIPLRPLAQMDTEAFMLSFDEPDHPVYDAFNTAIVSGLQAHEMVRMEQVAPAEVKHLMSTGSKMGQGLIKYYDGSQYFIPLHEERFIDTLKSLAEPVVRAYARPIITTRKIDGAFRGTKGQWPAEFRVFVEQGKVVGVSNYYPQVEMDAETFRPHIRKAYTLANQIVEKLEELKLGVGNPFEAPDLSEVPEAHRDVSNRPAWMPDNWGHQSYTLDFIVTHNDDVRFIEGGPAGLRAAHPCCFSQDDRPMSNEYLHGVALSVDKPVQALSDFID